MPYPHPAIDRGACLPTTPQTPDGAATQRVVKIRRDYNTWAANESLEDYALRFTPRSFRKWSEIQVANTAFGAASFLVLEAVGATMLVNYGFINTFWAILATGLIIVLTGIPISYYAATYGVDMDLLTRGAGFGYIGSTITSLIYASFTFILFALEAAIMAYALELYFGLSPPVGYLVCALVVIPLVTHGVTLISRLQIWSQPLWLVLLALPYVFVFAKHPTVLQDIQTYAGAQQSASWAMPAFGAALTIGVALITQMGEQVDYLRFMPPRTQDNTGRWFGGMLMGGVGWIFMGVFKMIGGALLAYLALQALVPQAKAVDPNQMYFLGFMQVFESPRVALAVTALFVIISQLKINVTNAYAGSLAWSNFFARLTHSHPGRVVWVVFNTLIALVLMELDMFQALGQVLGLYSNVAVAWIVTVVADLMINKPLGLSPRGIEFKRAYLYDINPVGVGSMLIASTVSVLAFLGVFGGMAQSLSAFIAMGCALVCSPLIAWLTHGKYYLAREPADDTGQPVRLKARHDICCICEKAYEGEDMAYCPAYQASICSLCCSLDARCDDLCKPHGRIAAQWTAILKSVVPQSWWRLMESGLGRYLLLMGLLLPVVAMVLGLIFYHQRLSAGPQPPGFEHHLEQIFIRSFASLSLVCGVVVWVLVLTHKSRTVAQEESNRQTFLLMQEIDSHRKTDEQLQKAKQGAELANQAKSRYVTAISHELRTPLNSILGYAQILNDDLSIPEHRRQAVSVIKRSGEHLLSLIEGTLDIARIEGGRLTLETAPLDFPALLTELTQLFEVQAQRKGIEFAFVVDGKLPACVRTDEKRLRQILINVIGNAVKFTRMGRVALRLKYGREMAVFEIEDTGPGIAADELNRIFEPFVVGVHSVGSAGGSGLGLTISKMLVDLMGGEMTVHSQVGVGTTFRIRLFLPQVHQGSEQGLTERHRRQGYLGPRRQVLVVDNEKVDRELMINVLLPMGFEVYTAASGMQCIEMLTYLKPDVILMDLAMPGMDGWQTIDHIRKHTDCKAHVAVVSANAFDKHIDNPVGLEPKHFILKPVRINRLLDWLGESLGLEWTYEQPRPTDQAIKPLISLHDDRAELPERPAIKPLEQMIAMGYLKGILRELDTLEKDQRASESFLTTMRHLARTFQFETMQNVLKRVHDA